MKDTGHNCRRRIGSALAFASAIFLSGVTDAAIQDDDPSFGPWYNLGERLPEGQGQTNRVPADAGADGVQRWAFVDAWLVSGPYTSSAWTAETPAYPKGFTNIAQVVKKTRGGKAEQPDALVGELDDSNEEAERRTSRLVKELDGEGAKYTPPPWVPTETNGHLGVQWPPPWRFVPGGKKANPDPQADAGIEKGYFYATTFIHAEKDMEVWVAVGADDRAKVWVNGGLTAMGDPVHPGTQTVTPAPSQQQGKLVPGAPTLSSPLTEDLLMFRAKLTRGPNRVVVCCANDTEVTYFWMRVCLRGHPQPAASAKARARAVADRLAASRPVIQGFRNDSRNSFPDAKPVTAWDWEKGTNIRWRTPLFLYSKACPIVVGDKVFTLLDPDGLICLDKNTGKILWERECSRLELIDKALYEQSKPLFEAYRAARDRFLALSPEERTQTNGTEMNDAAVKAAKAWRSFVIDQGKAVKWGWSDWTGHSMGTPVTDGRYIWVKFATGVAACYDLDGNRRWMVQTDLSGHWHAATSPILVGDPAAAGGRAWFIIRLPVDLLDKNGKMNGTTASYAILALDAQTGAVAWRTQPLAGSCDCASPVAVRLSDGAAEMDVVVTQGGIVLRAEDGKVLCPGIPFAHTDVSTATVAGDVIFQANGTRVTAHQLIMLDRDTIGVKWLWSRAAGWGGYAGGLALHGGRLYGIAGPQGCYRFDVLDARTGFPVIPESRLSLFARNYVPPVGAGEYVILADNGVPFAGRKPYAECMVIRTPEGRIVARNQFEKAMVASPVFDGDRMYVRTDSFLTCIAYTGEEGKKYEAEQNARKYDP